MAEVASIEEGPSKDSNHQEEKSLDGPYPGDIRGCCLPKGIRFIVRLEDAERVYCTLGWSVSFMVRPVICFE